MFHNGGASPAPVTLNRFWLISKGLLGVLQQNINSGVTHSSLINLVMPESANDGAMAVALLEDCSGLA